MTRLMTIAALATLLPIAAQAQTAQAPLVLERVHSPFVVAPDYKIADVDGNTGQLAGAYAGRLLDETLFVGGGFYWLVNGDRGEEMRYGGLMLGWSMPAGRMVRFGARGLVGLGTATLGTDLAVRGGSPRTHDRFSPVGGQGVRSLARDDFFVFEPQINATVRLIRHVGVDIGGGYRISRATDALDDRLNGATGSCCAVDVVSTISAHHTANGSGRMLKIVNIQSPTPNSQKHCSCGSWRLEVGVAIGR